MEYEHRAELKLRLASDVEKRFLLEKGGLPFRGLTRGGSIRERYEDEQNADKFRQANVRCEAVRLECHS